MPASAPRNYFTSPVRLGQGLQVASGRNAAHSNVILTNGDYVDTASNLVIDYSERTLKCSNITVGVSGTDTAITAIRVYSATLGSGSIAANLIVQSSFTVTGLTTSDKVIVNPPTSGITSGAGTTQLAIAYAFVSAADTLAIGFLNPTGTAVVHTTGTYLIVAIRS